ncbi:MAG: T9SS type A sorting domain-containing protein, partial [Bacteroidetes bacterium]|nr:T9SS type A sorting domain-containing protein [Bacteroidota bacterium]
SNADPDTLTALATVTDTTYLDTSPLSGTSYYYISAQDIHNNLSEPVSDSVGVVVSADIEVEIIPTEFALYQNYPNPFNPSTKIRYQLPQESKVIIKLYDILGAEVITLLNEKKEAGVYEVNFDGGGLTSGIYFYRFQAGNFVETKMMILLK